MNIQLLRVCGSVLTHKLIYSSLECFLSVLVFEDDFAEFVIIEIICERLRG